MPITYPANATGPGALAWEQEAPVFFAIEVDAYSPASVGVFVAAEGWGTRPRGALAELDTAVAASYTIHASDLGYRTSPADGTVVVYPPVLDGAFAINRQWQLDPLQSSLTETWGTATLLNPGGYFDGIAASMNSDNRGLRIFAGRKIWDATRLIWLDPSYSTLVPVFEGVAETWQLTEANLSVPINDPSYWLQTPIQSATYGGTGTYDGTTALVGKAKPKARGGSAAAPIKNVTPVCIDPTNLIFQYSDAPGTVVALYEGGDSTTILPTADVANLYSGTVAAGHYRTNNARGLFQLGSTPASGRAITIDCTGAFVSAGAVTNPVLIAKAMILEDVGVPSTLLNTALWTSVAAQTTATAGIYISDDNTVQADAVISTVLGSINGRLMASRNGLLAPYLLAALPNGAVPAVTFTTDNAVDVQRLALPDTLDPPTSAWKVGYNHNYTVMTSGLSPNISATLTTYLGTADTFASASSTWVINAYRRPNVPNPLTGVLLTQTDAQNTANALIALWGAKRRLFQVTVPMMLGLAYDLGSIVRLVWPVEDLANGQLGQIVGEATRTLDDPTLTFTVLI